MSPQPETNNTIEEVVNSTPDFMVVEEAGENTTTILPPLTESENLTFRVALDRALQYVTATTGVPREQLLVDNEQGEFVKNPEEKLPIVLDRISNEEVYYFHVIDESWDLVTVYAKLIVDSRGNVMESYDYRRGVSEHYRSTAGNVNLGLYLLLRDMEPQETIDVKIFVNDANFKSVVDYLESESQNITGTTGIFCESGRIIYATLPAHFVLSLAHRGDISAIEEDTEWVEP